MGGEGWKVGTTRHQAELLGGPELLFELELELAPCNASLWPMSSSVTLCSFGFAARFSQMRGAADVGAPVSTAQCPGLHASPAIGPRQAVSLLFSPVLPSAR